VESPVLRWPDFSQETFFNGFGKSLPTILDSDDTQNEAGQQK
jgi:hypothetical protein